MSPAYGLTIGNLDLSSLDFPVPFVGFSVVAFGCPSVRGSLSCGPVIQLASVGHVGSARIRTARNSPVVPGGWRRGRWLKRKEIAACFTGLVPSVGGASESVDFCNHEIGKVKDAPRSVDGDVDADALVDGRCDGYGRYHERTNIGQSTYQGRGCMAIVSLVVSSGLSSCLSVCPPPARPAPGSPSFPPCFIPLPPAHSALCFVVAGACSCSFSGGGHLTRHVFAGACPRSFAGGGHLTRPLFAGASLARPGFPVPSGSSVPSRGSFHPAGQCRLPSQGVVSSCCSVRFGQSKCGNVSTKKVVMLLLLHSLRQVWHQPNHHAR